MARAPSRRRLARVVAALAAVALSAGAAIADGAVVEVETLEAATEALRLRLESPVPARPSGQPLYATVAVPAFYEARGFRPVWFDGGGPRPMLRELIRAIEAADSEGLIPDQYHLGPLKASSDRTWKRGSGADSATLAAALTSADLLATDAFLILGAHLVNGRVDPVDFDPEWVAVRREVDLVRLLEDVASGRVEFAEALRSLRPTDRRYDLLVAALARYRGIAADGGWATVGEGPSIKPGESDDRVLAVRRRLSAADGPGAVEPEGDPRVLDDRLQQAVRAFQARHGLDADGVVGSKTVAAMNVAAAERVRQIELNLERWRWVPRDLGARHVLVNIPAFDLEFVDGERAPLHLRVVVGREARRTPVFSDVMRYLVINPSWEVPPTILVKDKLPEVRRDPDYVARNGMTLFRRVGDAWEPVDPHDPAWRADPPSRLRLRQAPGPGNALGRIKFMFPNPFNVYLHDTPARDLFAKSERAFSSGCIRVERPVELALELLRDDPRWTEATLERAIADGEERTVTLPAPVRVHLLYWTAFVDDVGTVQFRRDPYGRDAKLDAALDRPPPEPQAPPAEVNFPSGPGTP